MIKEKHLLKVNCVSCESYNRYFITLDGNEIFEEKDLLEQYKELYRHLLDQKIIPVYEKIFGNHQIKGLLDQARGRYIKQSFPSTFVNYPAVNGSIISSVFVYGIEITNPLQCFVNYLTPNVAELTTNDATHLYVSDIKAPDSPMSNSEVYDNLFYNMGESLKGIGYQPREIVRTWFYMSDMLCNYKLFNESRKNFFSCNGILYDESANRLPSSTCIGTDIPDGDEIQVDFYCIKQAPNMPVIQRVFNEKQNEANGINYLFQSTFARATEITTSNYTEVQISGTACIDVNGNSIHLDDPYMQIATTLDNVLSILKQYDMDLSHLVQSTCFFKKKEYYEYFLRALDLLKINNFSSTFLVGDVCRDDLLFELDGVAVKTGRNC